MAKNSANKGTAKAAPEAPKAEAPAPEAPKAEAPAPEAPAPEAPAPEAGIKVAVKSNIAMAKDSQLLEEAVDMVIAVVPKTFRLRLDHNKEHLVPAGTQKMPRAMAEHWYSKANGVTIFNPEDQDNK